MQLDRKCYALGQSVKELKPALCRGSECVVNLATRSESSQQLGMFAHLLFPSITQCLSVNDQAVIRFHINKPGEPSVW